MKLFSFIFSIYIISLLVYPCQESSEISSHNTEQSQNTNHSHNEQDCHSCAPFCICNCCQVNTLTSLKVSVKAIPAILEKITFIYKETSVKDIVLTIWQPPKA
ncbi:MAG: hypothetical protein A2033_12100 [Bacteroidetes bacterium GWA2_31_9]|nr:MAG: hypothetical protein A2033_12100 [Bacteroidetes bacterium GWA2_31_9]